MASNICPALAEDAMLRACAALRVNCFSEFTPPPGTALFGEAADRAARQWVRERRHAEEARMEKMHPLG